MISSATRALEILTIIGRSRTPVGVVDVARTLGIGPGTAFRSLNALEGMDYLSRYQSSARYVLGPVAERLYHRLLSQFRLREVSLPYLDQLAFATGEIVSLWTPVGWYGLRLVEAKGARDVAEHPPVGDVRLLEDTLPGRMILASMAPSDVDAYLAWSAVQGSIRSRTMGKLRKEFSQIARQGFATGELSYAPGQRSVALPLRGADGGMAAIVIEGPVLEDGDAGAGANVSEWSAVVAALEHALRLAPDQADNPFSHLARDDVALHVEAP